MSEGLPIQPRGPHESEPVRVAGSNRFSLVVSWTLILATVAYVAVGVNLLPELRKPRISTTSTTAPIDKSAADEEDITLRINSRLAVGWTQLRDQLDTGTAEAAASNNRALMQNVRRSAHGAAEEIRAAIVAGEVLGGKDAIAELEKVNPTDAELHNDAAILRKLYGGGSDALNPTQRDRLVERYGWFGKLALVWGKPASDPQRAEVIGPARRVAIIAMGATAAVFMIGLIGLLMFLLTLVLLITRVVRPQFVPVVPHRTEDGATTLLPPVFLEAFALYITGFVVFAEAVRRLVQQSSWSMYFLAALILPIGLLWPVRRGASWRQSLAGFGWHGGVHRGTGLLIEPFLGIVGYVAFLPIVAIGFVITLWLAHLAGVSPSHPIVHQLTGDWRHVVMIYILACVWAPLMEETFFRGALYNHLRGRHHWLISSLIVGLLFALIHPQGWTTIPALGAIGMVFGWIREWRGSIIGCMAAHALNNGVVVTLALLLLR